MRWILLTSCLVLPMLVAAQQYTLRLYRGGTKQPFEFHKGEEFTFRLHNGKDFYTYTIADLNPLGVVLKTGLLPLDSIADIRIASGNRVMLGLSRQLMVFSASWAFYSGVDVIMSNEDRRRTALTAAYVCGTSLAASAILHRLGGGKTYSLDHERRFLRIMEQPRNLFYPQ